MGDVTRPVGTVGKWRKQLSPILVEHASRSVSVGAGLYATLGGLLSFAGWAADIPRLTDWWGTGITIKANAAIGITAVGVALLIAALSRKGLWLVQILGFFAGALGALTLCEHLTSYDLGIDTLLFDEPVGVAGTAAPGRMGPPGAASLVALGVALVVLKRGGRTRILTVVLRRARIPAVLCSNKVFAGSRSLCNASAPTASANNMVAVCTAMPVKRGMLYIACAP
jgi:hypothetical protein